MASASHILPPATSQSIFTTQIVPNELAPVLAQNHQAANQQPLAVLIAGQTGAGKTRLAPTLLSAMATASRRHPAHFIADTYKTYHPSYAAILRSSTPALASAAAGADARRWLAMACALAAEHRLDVLVESACRHPDDFRGLARLFRAAGYAVAVALLAVPAALSRLGVMVRFYAGLSEAGSGGLPSRLTPRGVHDDSYAGLGEVARFVDESDVADVAVVVRRGLGVAYENRIGEDGRWRGQAAAARALEAERKRPLSEEEREVVREGLEMLGQVEDNGVREQIEEIRAMVDGLETADAVDDDGGLPALVKLDAVEFIRSALSEQHGG